MSRIIGIERVQLSTYLSALKEHNAIWFDEKKWTETVKEFKN